MDPKKRFTIEQILDHSWIKVGPSFIWRVEANYNVTKSLSGHWLPGKDATSAFEDVGHSEARKQLATLCGLA